MISIMTQAERKPAAIAFVNYESSSYPDEKREYVRRSKRKMRQELSDGNGNEWSVNISKVYKLADIAEYLTQCIQVQKDTEVNFEVLDNGDLTIYTKHEGRFGEIGATFNPID